MNYMYKNKICFIISILFLLFNIWVALSVGWGGEQNFELGWIFLWPILVLVNTIFSLVLIVGLIRKKDDSFIEIVQSLFLFLLINIILAFYIDLYHHVLFSENILFSSLIPYVPPPLIIVISAIIISLIISITKARRDHIILKKLLVAVSKSLLLIVVSVSVISIYSSYYSNKAMEKGYEFEEKINNRKASNQQQFNMAQNTKLEYHVFLNEKEINDVSLYVKKTRNVNTSNQYIDINFKEGQIMRSSSISPGDYIIAPMMGNVFHPNFNIDELTFRGPYTLTEGQTLNINIELTQQEYQRLLNMQNY